MHLPRLFLSTVFALLLAGLPSFLGAAEVWCEKCPAMVAVPPAADGATALWLSRSEITFDQWRACVDSGGCRGGQDDHGWGRENRPVINVTWDDANAYAAWLSRISGHACRLPTEAEWMHAASTGAVTAFWWGNDHGQGMANCRDCNPKPIYGSTPAGTFPANPYGLVDMNGNVWEWVEDCWQGISGKCSQRTIKGGSWYYYSPNATTQARARNDAGQGSYNIGFRVACSP
ncbi:formylglycine-generating enzyme family protein [Magnetospirillum aberrantis SpK]|uniref:Formylglycine-generating enzyme family protein n=2 Tax=Magnetospirillum TaxID=13134 RepID=A0A7C9QSS8_9PROT|nr:formylglycine-generating enzyme family protein [Magnetospirillum aberrantis SpK]